MTWLDPDLMRWINVALSGAVVALLITGAMHRWEHMPRRFKRITPWVIGTYVISAYGSGEIAASDVEIPIGFRVVLLMVNLIGLLIALLLGMGDDEHDDA